MNRKVLRFVYASLTLLVVLGGVVVNTPNAQAFDQNMVMSDAMFDNVSTMNASDIDAFLNKYPNSCISTNNNFSAPDPTGYNPSAGFTFGANVSAGKVIYDAAQAYGLNPQVLIATLQKEQSLVTGSTGCRPNTPDPTKTYQCNLYGDGKIYNCTDACPYSGGCMTIAVGYGCPGACNAAQEGFSQQLVHAAWFFKFDEQRSEGNTSWAVIKPNWDNSDDPTTCYQLRMTQGYRARCQGDTPTYFDGLTTIDGTSVSLTNGATAALYNYTPHFSGNQSFVNIFESTFGFGSTTSGMLSIAHPNGTLVRAANSPEVYLITGGKAQYATSLAVLQSWGYDMSRLKIATQGDLSLMAATDADTSHTNNPAPLQFRVGTLVKGASTNTVYVVENDNNGNNVKQSLVDLSNFTRLGYNFNQVLIIPDAQLPATTGSDYGSDQAAHPDGTLVRDANDPTVYYIVAGGRHSMTSLHVFVGERMSFSKVVMSTAGDDQLPISWAVTWYAAGTLIKGSGPTVYITDLDNTGVNQTKRNFVTYYNFVGLDYHFNEVMQVSDGELPGANGPDIGQ